MEACRKFTNVEPSTVERQSLLRQHVISQSATNESETPKVTIRPTNPDVPTPRGGIGVFNNRDQAEEEEKTRQTEQGSSHAYSHSHEPGPATTGQPRETKGA